MKKYLLIFISIMVLVGCGKREEKNYDADYQKLEDTFLKAGEAFINNDNVSLVPTDGTIYSIRLENLYNGDYLEKLIDPKTKEECNKENSFIHVQKINDTITYTVNLVCGDYSTN